MTISMFKPRLTYLMVSLAVFALYIIGSCKFIHFCFCDSSPNQEASKLQHEIKKNSQNFATVLKKKNVTGLNITGSRSVDPKGNKPIGKGVPAKQTLRSGMQKVAQSKDRLIIPPCTLSDVEKRKKTVVLTTTNAAFIDFADNWLESVKRTKTCPYITIVAEDDVTAKHYEKRQGPGLHVLATNSGKTSSGRLKFDSKDFWKFVNKRPSYILSFLEKGYNVLFTDVDMFWVKDPFPFFEDNFDMALAMDSSKFFCTGFVYYKPTKTTIKFLKVWIDFMKSDPKYTPDREVLSEFLIKKKVPELKLKVLSSENFPNGALFFDEKWHQEKKNVVVVHNNFVVGHDVKIERFRKVDMWLAGGG